MGKLEAAFLACAFAGLFSVSWGSVLYIVMPELGLFMGGACWMYAFRWFYVMATASRYNEKEQDG